MDTIMYHGATSRGEDEEKLGPAAEAVDVFFDRLFSLLPIYVPRFTSTLIGMAAGAVVVALLTPVVMQAREDSEKAAPKTMAKVSWLLFLVGALLAGLVVQVIVSNVHYRSAMIRANKQHFANVHWVGEYVRAARAASVM